MAYVCKCMDSIDIFYFFKMLTRLVYLMLILGIQDYIFFSYSGMEFSWCAPNSVQFFIGHISLVTSHIISLKNPQ